MNIDVYPPHHSDLTSMWMLDTLVILEGTMSTDVYPHTLVIQKVPWTLMCIPTP